MVVSYVLLAALAVSGYFFCLSIYRVFFHPLHKFPGPKLAGLTRWYEAYYEIVKNGQFSFHIEDLHRKYGPVIRITPDEIHIDDAEWNDALYAKNHKQNKYEWMSGRFGNNSSVFTTADASLHRIRRAPLNPMFSRRAIMSYAPFVQKKIDTMCSRMVKHMETGQPANMRLAYSALTGDIITQYCFGFCYNHLESAGFEEAFHEAFGAVAAFGHIALQFPWIHPVLRCLPDSWNIAMNPSLAKLLQLQADLRLVVARIGDEVKRNLKSPEHPTIFHSVLASRLPDSEKHPRRLGEEAQTILAAGTETTAWALSNVTFYVLSDTKISSTLKAELLEAIPDISAPDAFDYQKLERLPYLRGCIKEGIRLSGVVTARNPRQIPEPLEYKGWKIPPHTPVSMSIGNTHFNEAYFPEPRKFIPERWLEAEPTPHGWRAGQLDKYFVAFGRGPRSCLGINLAYLELHVTLATVFRRFELELYDTDQSDVAIKHDFMLPSPNLDSKGVRVKVLESL